MNKNYVGNSIEGNFTAIEQIKNADGYHIEKIDSNLYLVKQKNRTLLKPTDENAEIIVDRFSDEVGDLNESIYEIKCFKNSIVVSLYAYVNTIKLLSEKDALRIYFSRKLEQEILLGSNKTIQLEKKSEIVPYLRKSFLNNRSIFVHLDPKNDDSFEIFGPEIRAQAKLVRTGVYEIMKVYKTYNKEMSFNLTQLFGNVDFILFNDSLSLDNSNAVIEDVINGSDIFRTWESYLNFQQEKYKEQKIQFGSLRYSTLSFDGDTITFNIDDEIQIDDIEELEFAFISTYDRKLGILDKDINFIDIPSPETREIYVGQIIDKSALDKKKLIFKLPLVNYIDSTYADYPGYICLSNLSFKIEKRRRDKIIRTIQSGKNDSCNLITKLCNPNVKDGHQGTDYNPVDEDVLMKMFGNKDTKLKETYREAMYIALNTPDIALIQGPPGTGKSTLISGITTKLLKANKNLKILVSAEQHVALDNVVKKISTSKLMPPYVISKRFTTNGEEDKEDVRTFEKNINTFKESCIAACDALLKELNQNNEKGKLIIELTTIFKYIENNGYSLNDIKNYEKRIKEILLKLNYIGEMSEEIFHLDKLINLKSSANVSSNINKNLISKIKSQRIDYDVYVEDDGKIQFESLLNELEILECDEFLLPPSIKRKLLSDDANEIKEVFNDYINFVEELKDAFIPKSLNVFNDDSLTCEETIQNIKTKFYSINKNRKKDFIDIIQDFRYRLNDIDAIASAVAKYTSVNGSTCAQAEKTKKINGIENVQYDVVIIDEAARANPIDIMLPITLGARVILIGDHKQLPQFIETKYANEFLKKNNSLNAGLNKNLLTKSLFETIFDNLEKAYQEGRIKFKRTIQLNEQHRMNPDIGNFISNEFYDGKIKNADTTANLVNDFNVCDGKNIAWLNIDYLIQGENKEHNSYTRTSEVGIIQKFLNELIANNPNRDYSVGIISFYKAQANLIREMIDTEFPNNGLNIKSDTVDSYQGEEFDIVILSGVRSNNYLSSSQSLGFIDHSESRINVALSRAKKLLVFVGDQSTYVKNIHFRKFLEYVNKEGYYEEINN